MNLIIVAVVCVVFGCLLGMYAAKNVKSCIFASSVWMKNEKFLTYEKLKCMNEEWME
jgi:hypothetical protein